MDANIFKKILKSRDLDQGCISNQEPRLRNGLISGRWSKIFMNRFKTKTFAKKTRDDPYEMRKYSMQFYDNKLEEMYRDYQVEDVIKSFQFLIVGAVAITFLGYLFIMISYPTRAIEWKNFYQNKTIDVKTMRENNMLYCTQGYHCQSCPTWSTCGDYSIIPDAIIISIEIIIAAVGIAGSIFFKNDLFKKYYDIYSLIFIVYGACVSIITRFSIVEQRADIFFEGIILIAFILCALSGFQMRFIFGAYAIGIITLFWIPSNYWIFVDQEDFIRPYALLIFLTAAIIVMLYNTSMTEKFKRESFIRNVEASKTNEKLVKQLEALQNSYSSGMIDLESPLEKAILLSKSMIADPKISSHNLENLRTLLQLLVSPNINTPDFEAQLNERPESSIGMTITEDQKAWIFNEFAKKAPDVNAISSIVGIREAHDNAEDGSDLVGYNEPPSLESSNFTSVDSISVLKFIKTRFNESKSLFQKPKYDNSMIRSLLQDIQSWEWNVFEFSKYCPAEKPLHILTWYFFESSGLFKEFSIPRDKFNRYFWIIQEGYLNNPYHNSVHAADVMHAAHHFSFMDKISSLLTPIEMMALYFSAAVHDFHHPGVNNNFLITTKSSLAILYNDNSVLENFHLSAAFEILLRPENNFLSELSESDWKLFRGIVIELVMATDMAHHYKILGKFKAKLQSGSFNPYKDKEDRMLLLKLIMKCSDTSNPAKPINLYLKWTESILNEWKLQGDEEKEFGMPVSPFMDRESTDALVSSQIGFIDFIILPMFRAMDEFIDMSKQLGYITKNRRNWRDDSKDSCSSNSLMLNRPDISISFGKKEPETT